MIIKRLQPGERVELRLPQRDEPAVVRVRVQDITPEGIYLDRPMISRRRLDAPVGETVEIEYKRPDAIYSFTSRILDLPPEREIPALLIEHPKDLKRVQRREHFRIDVLLGMTFKLYNPEETVEEKPRSGWVLNLSAGGVRFGARAEDTLDIWMGTALFIDIKLSAEDELRGIVGQVLKIGADPQERTRSVIVCRFLDISPKACEAIIVHNIQYQRRWRTDQSEQP